MYIIENRFEQELRFSQQLSEDPINPLKNSIEHEKSQKEDDKSKNNDCQLNNDKQSPSQKSAEEGSFKPQKVVIVEEEVLKSVNKKIVINSFFILNFESLL